jgi:hypothetical protein
MDIIQSLSFTPQLPVVPEGQSFIVISSLPILPVVSDDYKIFFISELFYRKITERITKDIKNDIIE